MLGWHWLRHRDIADWCKRIIVIVVSLSIVIPIYVLGKQQLNLSGTDEGLFTEIVGIILTVLLIDGLRSIDIDIETKEALIRRASSTSNESAKTAVDELRKIGLMRKNVLRDADLSGANLSQANFENADLKFINLEGANLSEANLEGADLEGAILKNADLTNARMKEAKLMRCNLEGANFTCANLERVQLKSYESGKTSSPLKMDKAIFRGANLTSVDFSDLNLGACVFTQAILRYSHFINTQLPSATFQGADLRNTNFTNANLTRCDLSDGCELYDANMENCNMTNADISNSFFERTNLQEANLTGCIYGSSVFNKAILYGAILTGAKNGQDENGIDYDSPDFTNANFDSQTLMPDGSNWRTKSNPVELEDTGSNLLHDLDSEGKDFDMRLRNLPTFEDTNDDNNIM